MRLEFEPTTIEESGIISATENAATSAPAPDTRELLRKGINAAQAGNRSEARAFLQSVVETEPKNENAWLWLASISEYPEELMVFLENVLEVNPQNKRASEWMTATKSLLAKTFVQRGIDAVESGHKDFAADCFNSALEHDQSNSMAWLWMASLCDANEGKMAYLERVLAIDPENETARAEFDSVRKTIVQSQFQRAKSAAVSGNLKDAVEELSAVLAEAPELEEAWIFKSHIVESFRDKIATLQEGLIHHPESVLISSSLTSLKAIVDSAMLAEPVPVEAEQVRSVDHAEANNAPEVEAKPESNEPAAAIEEEETETAEPTQEYVEYFAEELNAKTLAEEPVTFAEDHAEPPSESVSNPWESTADDEQTGLTETYFVPETVAEESIEADEESLLLDSEAEILTTLDPEPEYTSERMLFEHHESEDTVSESELPEMSEAVVDRSDVVELSVDAVSYPMEVEQPPVYPSEEIEEVYEVKQPEPQAVYERTDRTDELPVSFTSEIAESELLQEATDNFTGNDESVLAEPYIAGSAPVEMEEEMEAGIPQPPIPFAEPDPVKTGFETNIVRQETSKNEPAAVKACPYCSTENDAHNYVCNLCMSVFTLSDLELLIANQNADHSLVRPVVNFLEEERTKRELTENELTTLGIGYLNLQDLDKGYELLSEASRSFPNNVILSSQVNSLHIRLEEIKKQNENQESMVRGKTIMVVDDSPTIRKLISGKLEKTGHVVHAAADGLEAVAMINDIMPDLVLLDITMPKMDGYQVCKAIRANQQTMNIPVVMISGKDGFFDKVRGRMAGTSGYITKPFGPETLMKAVETYLSNGHVVLAETGELQMAQPVSGV